MKDVKIVIKQLDFQDKDHLALVNRILKGDIVLFLGSGFSMGAISRYKKSNELVPIPNVKQLKKLLVTEVLDNDKIEDESLKDLCEECQSDCKSKYAEFMRKIFTVKYLGTYHKLYSYFSWKNIFTVNVDNVIESIYDSDDISCFYTEEPIHTDVNSIHIYKLHGCAIKSPEKIVFSNRDYITNAAQRNDYRYEMLIAALKSDNLLFIGTSLTEEWDLDIKCEQSNVFFAPNKTYFVLKDCDERLEKKLNRRFVNPIIIKETAESFVKKLIDYKNNNIKEVEFSLDKWSFRQIEKKNYDIKNYLKPDLYLGAEPTWEDIFSSHDVIWKRTSEILKNIEKNGLNCCTIIVGKPISGKTTMLYRLAAFLMESNSVYEYIGNEFINDLSSICKHYEDRNIILLIDNANWLVGRIREIIGILAGTNIKVMMTIREREYEKRQHLFDKKILENIEIIDKINVLRRKDIEAYLDKLHEKSFLGKYGADYQRKEGLVKSLYKKIKTKQEDALLRLALEMKYGKNLKNRLEKLGKSIAMHENYNIKRFVVMLYVLDIVGDVGLKLSLFLDLYPISDDDMKNFFIEIKDLLISNVNIDGWGNSEYRKIVIHSRLSSIVKNTVKNINEDEIREILEDIFHRLNRMYHYKSRQPNNYYNYVLYTLLRSQNLSELFRIKSTKIRWGYISTLYENLHDDFADYHIYWLHRGISEVRMKNFDSARIHLEQARAVRKGYSYEIEHSFAILYFEEAIHLKNISDTTRENKMKAALKIIREQIDSRENDAFSIHSFVVKTIQYYEKTNEEIPENLLKEMLKYYDLARNQFKLAQSTILRNMLRYIYRYLSNNNLLGKGFFTINAEEIEYLSKKTNMDKEKVDILKLI